MDSDESELLAVIATTWQPVFEPHPTPGAVGVDQWLEMASPSEAFSVHVVAFVEDRVVVIRPEERAWEMPGGRREPHETIEETARRELLEEAGVALRSLHVFATMWFRWNPPTHALALRQVAIGWGDADVIGAPTNPPAEIATAEVAIVDVEAAVAMLCGAGGDALAAGYAAAAHLRGLSTR